MVWRAFALFLRWVHAHVNSTTNTLSRVDISGYCWTLFVCTEAVGWCWVGRRAQPRLGPLTLGSHTVHTHIHNIHTHKSQPCLAHISRSIDMNQAMSVWDYKGLLNYFQPVNVAIVTLDTNQASQWWAPTIYTVAVYCRLHGMRWLQPCSAGHWHHPLQLQYNMHCCSSVSECMPQCKNPGGHGQCARRFLVHAFLRPRSRHVYRT